MGYPEAAVIGLDGRYVWEKFVGWAENFLVDL